MVQKSRRQQNIRSRKERAESERRLETRQARKKETIDDKFSRFHGAARELARIVDRIKQYQDLLKRVKTYKGDENAPEYQGWLCELDRREEEYEHNLGRYANLANNVPEAELQRIRRAIYPDIQ